MYDVNYFIGKFLKIPQELWQQGSVGYVGEPRCAYGHCGVNRDTTVTAEAQALSDLFEKYHPYPSRSGTDKFYGILSWAVVHVNDKEGLNPKLQILEALCYIKEKIEAEQESNAVAEAQKIINEPVEELV